MKFKDLFKFEKKEINATFENAKSIDKILGLKLLQAPVAKEGQDFGKLLIVASRKVGKAHKRNKIRRQLKSIFYQEKLYTNPVNTIILVYSPAVDLSFEEKREFLIKNFKK